MLTIKKLKEKVPVYDITVETTHNFYANDILVHNCVEINQNTSPSKFIEEEVEDGKIVIKYEPGDTVVCNLASINIAKVNTKEHMEEVLPITMRLLDNVIDLNFYPIKEAKVTALKYRPVGLGFLGLAEYLACNGLSYDSKEAREHVDKLFENFAYYTLKASNDLAKERGHYSLFEGSEWSKGIFFGKDRKWFEQNSELSDKWSSLIDSVKEFGTRFGYHQGIAPNTSCFSPETKVKIYNENNEVVDVTIYNILEKEGIDYKELEKKGEKKWIPLKNHLKVPTYEGDDIVEKVFYNGVNEVIELEFEDGNKYKFTPNHKLLVNRDNKETWVRVDELVEGDDIVNINK